MWFLSGLRHRLRVLFNGRHEQELREELEFHVEQLAAQHRSAGLGHDEALAAAQRQFGNLTRIQEQSHDLFAFRHAEDLVKDLRYGARLLVKHPGFSLIAMLSIAIGVGVNAAMFSFADGMLLRPLRVPRPGEVVAVSAVAPRVTEGRLSNRLSYPDYRDVRDRAASFAGLAAYRTLVTGFAYRRDEPAQTKLGLGVSGNFFDVLELRPALGRFFLPEEDRVPGRDPVIVLAYDTWIDQFGGDPAVVGRSVRLAGLDLTVVGVAPADFDGMHLVLPPAFYVPLTMGPAIVGSTPDTLEQRDLRSLEVRGRLRPGVSFRQAQEEVGLLAASLEQAYPDTNRGYGMLLKTQFDARLDERGPSAPSAFLLLALALVVLLVACANVSGLLLSRAPARARENRVAARDRRRPVPRDPATDGRGGPARGGRGRAGARAGLRRGRGLPAGSPGERHRRAADVRARSARNRRRSRSGGGQCTAVRPRTGLARDAGARSRGDAPHRWRRVASGHGTHVCGGATGWWPRRSRCR